MKLIIRLSQDELREAVRDYLTAKLGAETMDTEITLARYDANTHQYVIELAD